jgi:hypothetical protein
MSDVPGDNRLARVSRMMAYISTPLSKRGDHPQDIRREQILGQDTLQASRNEAYLRSQRILEENTAKTADDKKKKKVIDSPTTFKNFYSNQIEDYRKSFWWNKSKADMETIVFNAHQVQLLKPGMPFSFYIEELKRKGLV